MVNNKHTNICFDCINSVPDRQGHGCPWSERFEPVPGWTAVPSKLLVNTSKKHRTYKYYADTYRIIDCPQFIRDERGARTRC